ncbi:PREDICTED: gamma-glutamyltranspeptidase 1-like isoform X2 [Nicrophorus vespilloides]|uniref:Gamma-glutamyltranspeptidase 1-like isoform X2 n=1 Tax=Nicrophorus vespilloides TaxID=110193 RepID=A0ABM1M854_NICVS|nr:PREDICTED: gamma-glutamyltranspeptidase 1-like isoform X2 [Nicrophorus vespilloides]
MGVLDRGATLNISEGGKVKKSCSPRLKKSVVLPVVAVILVIIVIVILYLTGVLGSENETTTTSPANPTMPMRPSVSSLHTFSKAAVCADGPPCAQIGQQILQQKGSAVDATLAALFCNGLVNMQSMGLGGGFLMTIYKKDARKAYTLNARETAPLAATPNMFQNKPKAARKGPLSIGVPGELKGYWEAHQKFGKLDWKTIIQPTIDLCDKGYKLTIPQHKTAEKINFTTPTYKKWFYNDDGNLKKVGETVKPEVLCNTLRIIAEKGAEDFYTGSLSKMILDDLKKANSIITAEDLKNYSPVWADPISVTLNNGDQLYSTPPPGSGILLAFILKILDGFNFTRQSIDGVENTVQTYHRMIEAFKYAYAKRTELGDTKFINIDNLINKLASPQYAEEIRLKIRDNQTFTDPAHYGAVFYDDSGDNGTAHISVLDEYGDAVSVTSTINLYFGSEVISESTGITFNSVMDDFSTPGFKNYFGLPGSPNNAIAPGKRPLSSMSPSVMTDKNGDVILVVGASGGTQITTGIAQVIMRILWFGQNIKEAVDSPRIHHQVYPMQLGYEYGTLQQIIDGLEKLGHNTTRLTSYSVICGLFKKNDTIFANADHRKGGDVYGY